MTSGNKPSLLPVAILAGGLATRLRPLTEKIPKALIEIAGRPFIDWQLELLVARGVSRVVLCAGFLGNMIADHVRNGSRFGLEVDFSYDGEVLLGTGGAIRQALPFLGEEFFVLYGDSYLPVDYRAVDAAFRVAGKKGLMTVFRNDGQWDKSNVWMEGEEVRLYDKQANLPQMRHIDYGLSIFRAETFREKACGERFDLAGVMKSLVDQGQMTAFPVSGRFYEIGSIAGIADLERYLASKAPETAPPIK